MSRLTGSDALGLFEAYQAVYNPQELTEEQVWEEVENWVNDLIEEGYDLSSYTWDEMYDICLDEAVEGLNEIDSSTIARTAHKRMQNLSTAQEKENSARDAGATGELSRLSANTSKAAAKVSRHRALSSAHARSRSRMKGLNEIDSSTIARTDLKRRKNLNDAEAEEMRARDAGAPMRELSGLSAKTSKAAAKVSRHRALSSAHARSRSRINKEEVDIFDAILEHLIAEGYADTNESALVIMANMSEEWRESIMEKEDSEYEKASDAALDSRYGYGRASGDKRSFGRAANRSSAAAALRAIRRGERSGSGTSREAGSDAVHQGWAKTAKTSTDQTPEKKERRAGLANTPYSKLPDDEKEKDRVSFDAVRATYNKNKKP
jgi:hypothetical protein